MENLTMRQRQAIKTKDALLDMASQLLKDKTLDEISIQEICHKAGVSVGAFYHHFEGKAGIIIELYKNIDVYFEEVVMQTLDLENPVGSIIKYLEYQCQSAQDTGIDLLRNAYKAQINNGNLFFLSNERGLPNGLRKLVRLAKERGFFVKEVEVERITTELLIISRGVIYHWCVSGGESDMIKNVNSIATSYLNNYLKN